jgi:hypothetical protein
VASDPSWNVPAKVSGVRAVLALARAPQSERRDLGPWLGWNTMQREMTAPGAVGFFSQAPPGFTLPFAGQDFRRPVVNIGAFPWSGSGPAPGAGQIERMLAGAHIRYLYMLPGSHAYTDLTTHPLTELRPVPAVRDGSLLELTAGPPPAETQAAPHGQTAPRSRPTTR